MSSKFYVISEKDNCGIALTDFSDDEPAVSVGAVTDMKIVCHGICKGHKLALRKIAKGEPVIKSGYPIGVATENIEAGMLIHLHNLKSLVWE